ncbi:hypothetical protein FRC15_011544 [Serendipita sp. 397]|nr:hypothetical protein FRC15_011544 [Serendipita sp. 397]
MRYSVQVDDTSPILSYSGDWSSSASGGDTAEYWGASFHATSSNSSYVTLSFIGTGVTVYGSKGPDHGTFIATVDQEEHFLDAYEETNVYRTTMFSQTGLPLGTHYLKITNLIRDMSQPWLYLDYIDFETGQDDNIRNVNYTIDDVNSTISYIPGGAWVAGREPTAQHIDGTFHTSAVPGAQLSTHFEGNAIYVFGSLGVDYGLLNVTVDGSYGSLINCSASNSRTQALLHREDTPSPSKFQPTLLVQSILTLLWYHDGQTITVLAGKTIHESLVQKETDTSTSIRSKAKTPIIAGSICGALILLAWATYLGHWTWTQHKKRKNMRPGQKKLSDAMKLREEKRKEESETTAVRDTDKSHDAVIDNGKIPP